VENDKVVKRPSPTLSVSSATSFRDNTSREIMTGIRLNERLGGQPWIWHCDAAVSCHIHF